MLRKVISALLSTVTMIAFLTAAVSVTAETGFPQLPGRLVYHSYNSYGDGSSELFVFNFKTNKLECISSGWTNVKDPMNAVWTNDGKAIVFMGMNTVNPIWEFYSWDIFYYEIGSEGNPVNLTNDPWSRCEDPTMYRNSNNAIIYKAMEEDCNYIRYLSFFEGEITVNTLYSSTEIEPAMPFYTPYDICFSGLDKSGEMDIYRLKATAEGYVSEKVPYCSEPGVFEYYTVPASEPCWIFYTAHTNSDPVDYIYKRYLDYGESILMPFNLKGCDTADPCTVNYNYTVTSSIRPGGNGGYDLYLCDNVTGVAISLSKYNPDINTAKSELAACYTPINNAAYDLGNTQKFVLTGTCNTENVRDLDGNYTVDIFDTVRARRRIGGVRYTVDEFMELLTTVYKVDKMYFSDVTPINVFEETGCQIFKEYSNSTSFMVMNDNIYSIAENYGGVGLSDITTCDFNGDGVKDIIYSYSTGSGLHHCGIVYFNLATMEKHSITTPEINEYGFYRPFSYWEDMCFEKISDTELKVYGDGIADYTLDGPRNGWYIGKIIPIDGYAYISTPDIPFEMFTGTWYTKCQETAKPTPVYTELTVNEIYDGTVYCSMTDGRTLNGGAWFGCRIKVENGKTVFVANGFSGTVRFKKDSFVLTVTELGECTGVGLYDTFEFVYHNIPPIIER